MINQDAWKTKRGNTPDIGAHEKQACAGVPVEPGQPACNCRFYLDCPLSQIKIDPGAKIKISISFEIMK